MLSHDSGGQEGAPTLLLIHPMGADLTFWDACRAEWEPRFRCLAPDLRGAGRSPMSVTPITIEGHADDLAELLDVLEIERCVAVGCAVGSMVAAALAGRYPARCSGLVMSNPGFRIVEPARGLLAERARKARAEGMQAILAAATDTAFLDCPNDDRRAAYVARFGSQDGNAYALQIEGMLDADVSRHLGTIACPVLLVAGGKDRLLPPHHAHAIRERLPLARLEEIADGAHFIPYQRPAEFARLVTGFVDELQPVSA